MNNYQTIEKALIFLSQNFKKQPSLAQVARYVGLSEFHFQKVFTHWAGISPKKFLSYTNINYAKSILNQGGSIADATYETGLSATSRLHDLFVNIQAMTPAEYKNGGKNLVIKYSFNNSKFGKYLIASTQYGICELFFANEFETLKELKRLWPSANLINQKDSSHLLVKNFIDNTINPEEKINLHLKGTNFQIKVWEALLSILSSQITTYANIAKKINTKAYRAVGSAIGDNHISFIIPCHRVIKSTGEFGNYRWGSEKKLAMLGLEATKKDNHNRSIK